MRQRLIPSESLMEGFRPVRSVMILDKRNFVVFGLVAFVLVLLFGNTIDYMGTQKMKVEDMKEDNTENPEEGFDEGCEAEVGTSNLSQRVKAVCDPYLSYQLSKAVYEGELDLILNVSIRFTHELLDSETKDVEANGIMFVRVDEAVLHAGSVYPASGSVESIIKLAQMEIIEKIESTSIPKELPQ